MTTEVLSGFLAPAQAARQLGIAEGSLRYYARLGRLPVVMAGGRPLYRTDDIQRIGRERTEGEKSNV